MTNLTKIPTLVFTLCCLFLAPPTEAQQTRPQSRWVVGAHVGFPLILECGSCSRNEASTFFADGSVHFRLFRWLGLTADLGYNRQQSTNNVAVPSSLSGPYTLLKRDVFLHYTHLTIGPNLNIRLGQGDLGLGMRFGAFLNQTRIRALSTNNRLYEVRYRPSVRQAVAFHLDYTYWPQPKFGLCFGFEILADNQGFNSLSPTEALNGPLEDTYPDAGFSLLNALGPTLRSSAWVNLKLGVVYRLDGSASVRLKN